MLQTKRNNNAPSKGVITLRILDFAAAGLLLLALTLIIATSSSAVIRADSVDYYTILQRLTNSSKPAIVRNTHFVEQRSPGYSLLAIVPYYLATFAIEPFVTTETVESSSQPKLQPPPSPKPLFGRPPKPQFTPLMKQPPTGKESEKQGIPNSSLLTREIFFKNYEVGKTGAVYEWKIALALICTSYLLLFLGIFFSIKALSLRSKIVIGAALPALVIFSSKIFMHNIVMTPTYATLAAFGLSAIFTYLFICSVHSQERRYAVLAGLFIGFLVLTRFETALIAILIVLFWIFNKEWQKLLLFVMGGSVSVVLLIIYSWTQFKSIIHLGILRGDINQLGFDWGYIAANLINPQSGIVFWSTLTVLGIAGLFIGKQKDLLALGSSALLLVFLLLVRIPVMYKSIGGAPIDIDGVLVSSPKTMEDALMLVQSDANRYITVLTPFAILGLQNIIIVLGRLLRRQKQAEEEEYYLSADI